MKQFFKTILLITYMFVYTICMSFLFATSPFWVIKPIRIIEVLPSFFGNIWDSGEFIIVNIITIIFSITVTLIFLKKKLWNFHNIYIYITYNYSYFIFFIMDSIFCLKNFSKKKIC